MTEGSGRIAILAKASGQGFHLVEGGQGMMHGTDDETEPPHKFLGIQAWSVPTNRLSKPGGSRVQFLIEEIFNERKRIDDTPTDQAQEMATVFFGIIA